MARWFRRWGSRSTPPPQNTTEVAPFNAEQDEAILDALQKAARAQARLGARLDGLESKLEAGFTDLRAAVTTRAAAAAPLASLRWDDLLDAADLLDEAAHTLDAATAPETAAGLRGVATRLDRFLAQGGLMRLRPPPQLTDGKRFRVVGTEERPELPDGATLRQVRAAVLEGDRVIREGEVIINRRATTGATS